MHKRLRNSKTVYPFLYGRDSSLNPSVCNWVYPPGTIKCINNQKTMEMPITWWVRRSVLIYVDSAKRDSLILLIFQGDFISLFRLLFVVLANQTIGSECIYPIEHTRAVVESFCIVISFRSAHVSTHFVIISKSETC